MIGAINGRATFSASLLLAAPACHFPLDESGAEHHLGVVHFLKSIRADPLVRSA